MIRRLRASGERDTGFTLIELLVVIVIIGILAAIAIPVFLSQRKKGYDATMKSDLRNLAIAEDTFLHSGADSYRHDRPRSSPVATTSRPARESR